MTWLDWWSLTMTLAFWLSVYCIMLRMTNS